MSTYNCDVCSFYTDKKLKLIEHNNTQKHAENLKNKLNDVSPIECGQKKVKHRTLKKQKETTNLCPHPPTEKDTQVPSQSVFTLLEIKDNQVLSSRQVNVTNSIINFV
jgi:hypothetical protein